MNMNLRPEQQLEKIREILRGKSWPENYADMVIKNYPLGFSFEDGNKEAEPFGVALACPNPTVFSRKEVFPFAATPVSIADHATECFRQLKVIRELIGDRRWPANEKETIDLGAPVVFAWGINRSPASSTPSRVSLMIDNAIGFDRGEVFPDPTTEPPPLGLKPRDIHNAQRATDIYQAIGRYVTANKRVPAEWYEELQQLTDGFND